MRGAAILLLVTAACGRFSFDPRDASGSAGDDGALADGTPPDVTSNPALLLRFTFESDGLLTDRGTGHNATCSSCPATTPGPRPATTAALFDGVNDCLSVAWPTPRPTQLTFAAWVRMDDVRNETMFGSPYMSTTLDTNAFEIFSSNANLATVQLNTSVGFSVPAATGVWRHLAATYDGTDLRAYVDGTLFAFTASGAPIYTLEPMMIGCDRDVGSEVGLFFGALDEVRLYNVALTDAEVATLAQ